MMDLEELTRRYLRAVEEGDWLTLEGLYAPDVVQEEFPNRLLPQGATRNLSSIREASERGRKVLQRQTYQINEMVTNGDVVAFEATWEGILALPVGTRRAGEPMRARFAVFLEFRDGRIIAQRNYDCFEAF